MNLTNLENKLDRLENHHVQVKEFKDKIIFLRSIAKGTGDKSYGIHVGKMAGLPSSVIDRAYQILDEYLQFSNRQKGSIDSKQKRILMRIMN